MAIKRFATAHWSGSGKEGSGHLSSQSGILQETRYGFASRFADGPGTNPEELIAAAHAGCFSMKLAFNLQAKGYTADELETKAEITLADGSITSSHLNLRAVVGGISAEEFEELVQDAKANCPVSKLLRAELRISYQLNP